MSDVLVGEMTDRERFVREYYEVADSHDWDKLLTYLNPTVEFQFANGDPTKSSQDIKAAGEAMVSVLSEMTHTLTAVILSEDGRYSTNEMSVFFRNHDDRTLEVPACGVMHFDSDGLIDEYRVYVDTGDYFQ